MRKKPSFTTRAIVALLGFLTGLIMAYVGLIQLRQVGATVYVANLVSLAMTREMGALMTGIIACARTSTAYASQLGSMNVSQETDSLRALGINPIEYLALPRILAVTLMVPLLAVFATFIGIFGGMIVACAGDLSIEQYLTQAIRAISFKSFLVGFIKSIAFGFIAMLGMVLLYAGRSARKIDLALATRSASGITALSALLHAAHVARENDDPGCYPSAALVDGLWLELCLSPQAFSADEADAIARSVLDALSSTGRSAG